MAYLVYENRIGFPMRLNQVYAFEDLQSATRFARAQAAKYKEEGMTVENFNGHDWIWYAVDLTGPEYDQGIILQIFNESRVEGNVLT